MSYEPTEWVKGTKITATKLNNIEQGVQSVNSEYTPTTWAEGDIVTATKLNNIEQGIANAGGGGEGLPSYSIADRGKVLTVTGQLTTFTIPQQTVVVGDSGPAPINCDPTAFAVGNEVSLTVNGNTYEGNMVALDPETIGYEYDGEAIFLLDGNPTFGSDPGSYEISGTITGESATQVSANWAETSGGVTVVSFRQNYGIIAGPSADPETIYRMVEAGKEVRFKDSTESGRSYSWFYATGFLSGYYVDGMSDNSPAYIFSTIPESYDDGNGTLQWSSYKIAVVNENSTFYYVYNDSYSGRYPR